MRQLVEEKLIHHLKFPELTIDIYEENGLRFVFSDIDPKYREKLEKRAREEKLSVPKYMKKKLLEVMELGEAVG